MLHLVTGYAGEEHITSADEGAFNMATFGAGENVMDRGNKFAATVVSNNLITISDGEALMQGRFIKMIMGTTEEVNIENGTQGMNRNDLICLRYEKNSSTGVETASLVVKKGTETSGAPTDPAYTTGDITDGSDLVNEMPLYRVTLNGLNIASVKALFSIRKPASESGGLFPQFIIESQSSEDVTVVNADDVTEVIEATKVGSKWICDIPHYGTWEVHQGSTVVEQVVDDVKQYNITMSSGAPMYPFATATDAQLAAMLESYYNGDYDASDIALLKSTYLPIGAKRSMHLNAMSADFYVSESHHADDYEFVIIGHEHDDLVNPINGKTKALLTVQQDRILYKNTTDNTYSSSWPSVEDEGGYMNSNNTNEGGWMLCSRRSWCDNIYFEAISPNIRSLCKLVFKSTSQGNQSSAINRTTEKVFLLSEIEIFGTATYSKDGEGSQYEYYRTASNRYKKPSYQSYAGAFWWERSPCKDDNSDFCFVDNNSSANHSPARFTQGLAPAFCM